MNKIIGLFLILLSFNTYSNVLVSDCQKNYQSFEYLNDIPKHFNDCYNENLPEAENDEVYQAFISVIDETNDVKNTVLLDLMEYFTMLFLALIMYNLMVKLSAEKQKNKSDLMIKASIFIFASTIILSQELTKSVSKTAFDTIYSNNVKTVSSISLLNLETNKRFENIVDNEDYGFLIEKADDIFYSVYDSALCVNKAEQEYITRFGFNDKLPKEIDPYFSCMTEEIKIAPSFIDSGRSSENFATKRCNEKILSKSVDCGSIDANSNKLMAFIDTKRIDIEKLAKNADQRLCVETLEKLGDQKVEGLCREWNEDTFSLKTTDLSSDEIDRSLVIKSNQFREDFYKEIGSSIPIVKNGLAVSLYNVINQTLNTVRSLKVDNTEEINAQRFLVQMIDVKEIENRSLSNGRQTEKEIDLDSVEIESIDDYFLSIELRKQYLSKSVLNENNIFNSVMKTFADPKLMYGYYQNGDKENFKISPFVFQRLNESIPEMISTALIFKMSKGVVDSPLTQKLSQIGNFILIISLILFLPLVYTLNKSIGFLLEFALMIFQLIMQFLILVFSKKDYKEFIATVINFYIIYSILFLTLLYSLGITEVVLSISHDFISALIVKGGENTGLSILDWFKSVAFLFFVLISPVFFLIKITNHISKSNKKLEISYKSNEKEAIDETKTKNLAKKYTKI